MRSTATDWAKDSVLALDAGSHLASITRILDASRLQTALTVAAPIKRRASPRKPRVLPVPQDDQEESDGPGPPTDAPASRDFNVNSSIPISRSPFAQLAPRLPFSGPASSAANAAHIARTYISTYLITHAHLDHVSGLIVNTAAFQHQYRTRRIAALPGTIQALKNHIFNDIIWPNMSDEDGGIGLVSYMRLTEGGNVAAGEGDGKGYVEVCEGLAAKGYHISHGHCFRQANPVHSTHHEGLEELTDQSIALTVARTAANASLSMGSADTGNKLSRTNVYHSSMFFVRDQTSGMELAMFGDVEPDTISAEPRNERVWEEAAPKFVAGRLRGIVIECSYDDSQADEVLFGHVNPRHLMAELAVLAEKVIECKRRLNDAHLEAEIARKTDKRLSEKQPTVQKQETAQGGARGSPQAQRKRKRVSHGNVGSDERAVRWPPGQEDEYPSVVLPDVIQSGTSPQSTLNTTERRRSSLGALINLQQANDQRAESRHRRRRSSSGTHSPPRYPLPAPRKYRIRAPPNAPTIVFGSTTATGGVGTTPRGTHPTPPTDGSLSPSTHQIDLPRSSRKQDQQTSTALPNEKSSTQKVGTVLTKSWAAGDEPLKGLPIVIIHMKETLDGKKEGIAERVKRDLEAWEEREWKLGVQFFVTHVGMSLWL